MMTIEPGDFWVANIPFTSGAGFKKRPVLLLWLDGEDVVAAVKQVWDWYVKPQF